MRNESSFFPTVKNVYSFRFNNESAVCQDALISYFLQVSTKKRKIEDAFKVKKIFLQRSRKPPKGEIQEYKISGSIINNLKAGIQSNPWMNPKQCKFFANP